MQPKSSHQTNTSNSTSSSSSTSSATTPSQLLIPIERFKEICLRNSTKLIDSNSNELNSVLDYFFEPEKDVYKLVADFDLLKLYLTGGIGLDSFKTKSKILVFFLKFCQNKFN
jgi:hypothetical protein